MTWKQTYTGREIHALDLRVEDIDIKDIAQSLANTCRYNGHTKQHYSVAQHCVLVARYASAEDALRTLMHDAVEAYSPFGDMARPDREALNEEFPETYAVVKIVEDRIEKAIAAKFDLPFPIKTKAIGILDTRILHDERAQVMTYCEKDWEIPFGPLGVEIERWSPEMAREKFLIDYYQYADWNRKLNGCAA